MKEIVIATRNAKKLKEIKRLFKNTAIKTLSLDDFPTVPKIVEDGKDFKANAIKKAKVTSRFTKKLTLADDSGLEVNALKGKPGVKSSRYAGPRKSDKENIIKLLKALKNKSTRERKAQFRCVVAIAHSNKVLKITDGICKGKIGFEVKGGSGFGYDPVFIPYGYKKTFSELGPKIKDNLSHRAKALRKAGKFIREYL